ncbi:MAG TPA: gephyrin-like molybdotransferase Glp [Novimethylophilus sp.]|jgi:molybdopterin molybdotransferase|uniref:molybdopterin molybdotransferase MoeA n=1 Tax=Novimethylophilus sp. TaxID=2137426 RepID=UPI002F421981
MTQPDFIQASCADDYDPDSMPVDKARHFIRAYLEPVQAQESIHLRGVLGRVLAQDILSPCNVPNHDNSAMDGYALNGADLPASGQASLQVVGTAFAGKTFAGKVGSGECVRIMTGAVMPDQTDTVIIQEHVQAEGDRITFGAGTKAGQNRRFAGEDLKLGQVVLPAGHLVRPADLGLIASLGIGEVRVYRKLRAAFFSTGDELASIGQPLAAGQVYDSNRYTIYGMLSRLGVEIIDMGVVRDDPILLEKALIEASQSADVVLTSGGVSVGEADYMKELLNKLGQVVFWKIAMKPGRPLAYGRIGHAHYFGLPGNPVSVMVTFYQFVRDAMLVLMGQANPQPAPLLNAVCITSIKKTPGRTEFQRGALGLGDDGAWTVQAIGNQGSGVLRSMSEANCFIVLSDSCGNIDAGMTVQVQLMDGII